MGKFFLLLSFLFCGLANCFLFADNYQLSITEKDTIEHDPQYYFNQAMDVLKSAQARSDLKKAADLFEKAKALSPGWNDVYYNLGLLYEKLDCYSLAVDNLVVALRACISSAKHDTDECEQIAIRLGKDHKKSEMLEKAKSLMVNGKWNLIRKIPDDALVHTSNFYPVFSFDKEGKLWMANSKISFLKNFKPMSGDDHTYLIKENIKRHPRFVVSFDGKYFEIREFYIWVITHIDENTHRESEFFYPECTLYKGEIDISSPQILIKIREYVRHLWDNPYLYTSYNEADEESFKNLDSVVFDEQKNFRVESQWKIE
jgi:tetratricopeptide (TPR) repeat protein